MSPVFVFIRMKVASASPVTRSMLPSMLPYGLEPLKEMVTSSTLVMLAVKSAKPWTVVDDDAQRGRLWFSLRHFAHARRALTRQRQGLVRRLRRWTGDHCSEGDTEDQ